MLFQLINTQHNTTITYKYIFIWNNYTKSLKVQAALCCKPAHHSAMPSSSFIYKYIYIYIYYKYELECIALCFVAAAAAAVAATNLQCF